MTISEADRQKREKEILAYLQQKMKAKAIKAAVKPDSREVKKAERNIACTFCRKMITLGASYVSFRSQGDVRVKGKNLRIEKMHEVCLNRYLRPGMKVAFSR